VQAFGENGRSYFDATEVQEFLKHFSRVNPHVCHEAFSRHCRLRGSDVLQMAELLRIPEILSDPG